MPVVTCPVHSFPMSYLLSFHSLYDAEKPRLNGFKKPVLQADVKKLTVSVWSKNSLSFHFHTAVFTTDPQLHLVIIIMLIRRLASVSTSCSFQSSLSFILSVVCKFYCLVSDRAYFSYENLYQNPMFLDVHHIVNRVVMCVWRSSFCECIEFAQ